MNASHFFARARTEEFDIKVGQVLHSRQYGIHRSRVPGPGIDFRSVRERDPSDPISRIDRIASSKGPYHPVFRPVVRTQYAEKEILVLMVVDAGRTMKVPPIKMVHTAQLLWLWAASAFRSQDSFRVLVVSEDAIEDSGCTRSEESLQEALRHAQSEPRGRERSPYRYLAELYLTDAVLVVVSDFVRSAVRELHALKNLSVYERNVEVLFLALDEWYGYQPTGYGVEFDDAETRVRRVMSDIDIKSAARAADAHFSVIRKELLPFSGIFIKIPLIEDPIMVVMKELTRVGFGIR